VTLSATRGVPRVLRGLATAGVSAALAVAAHAAAGGGLPSTGTAVVLTAVLAGAGVALADRRRGFRSILAVVGAGQLGMHVLLDQFGHAHAGTDVSALMVVTHAVAAVAVAMLLAGAERSVFAVVAVLRWLLGGALTAPRPLPVTASPSRPAPASVPPGSITLDVLLRRANARRGPPEPR